MKIMVKCEKEIWVGECPFCRDDSMLKVRNYQGHHVRCDNCCAAGPKAHTEEKAVELWNDGVPRGDNDKQSD